MSGAKKLEDIGKDTELILYCYTGSRSAVASNFLRSMGFTKVVNGINKDQVTARFLSQ